MSEAATRVVNPKFASLRSGVENEFRIQSHHTRAPCIHNWTHKGVSKLLDLNFVL